MRWVCECPQVGRLVHLWVVLVAGRRGSCPSVLLECLDGWGRVGVPSACVRVWGWEGDRFACLWVGLLGSRVVVSSPEVVSRWVIPV